MGLFDLFARRPALSEGLEQYRNTSGAVLLDVRTLLPGDEAEIAAALKGLDLETLSLEEIVRQALKNMIH